ncbi:MAG: hypothetical protein ACLUNV_08435 [Sutterella wadsworthensis]
MTIRNRRQGKLPFALSWRAFVFPIGACSVLAFSRPRTPRARGPASRRRAVLAPARALRLVRRRTRHRPSAPANGRHLRTRTDAGSGSAVSSGPCPP